MTVHPTDQLLFDALRNVGVEHGDAYELAKSFANFDRVAFVEGLRAAATLMVNPASNVSTTGLLPPWDSITAVMRVQFASRAKPDDALRASVASWDDWTAIAICGAIGTLMAQMGSAATAQSTRTIGATSNVTPNQQSKIRSGAKLLQPPDPAFVTVMRTALGAKGDPMENRKKAGEQMIQWLVDHGRFVRTPYGRYYYLYRGTSQSRLFAIDSVAWRSWLYVLTNVNPAAPDFKFLEQDCIAAAMAAEPVDVVRVAHWDDAKKVLRVSRFDGYVYRLDGASVDLESNGDGPAIFEDAPYWTPYEADFIGGASGTDLNWTVRDVPHWDGDPDELSLLFRAWWLGSFFTEVCPTRPILVMKGEKGSGKSMSLRVLLRMMFGPAADVRGVPSKADAFMVMSSHNHIAAIDNMDTVDKDLRDAIASLATGKIDEIRELYKTNEPRLIHHRCWLAITSRTPDVLQRDDLIDRLLILPVTRIQDAQRLRESLFLDRVFRTRDEWWGDVLHSLNAVVAEIRINGIPNSAGLRLEDWAALGQVIARVNGQEAIWQKALDGLKRRRAEFLLQDDAIVQAIEMWIKSSSFSPNAIPTRSLYTLLKDMLYGHDRPTQDWPSSVKSFGRRMTGMQSELRQHLLDRHGVSMSSRLLGGYQHYQFSKAP